LITFNDRQGSWALEGITLDDILAFLTDKTTGTKTILQRKKNEVFQK